MAKRGKSARSSKSDPRDLSKYSAKSTRIVSPDYLLLAGPGSWLHSALDLGSVKSKTFSKGVSIQVASDSPSQLVRIPVDSVTSSYQHYKTASSITLSESDLTLSAKSDIVKSPSVLLEGAALDFGKGNDLMEVSKYLTVGSESGVRAGSVAFGDGSDLLRITGDGGLKIVNGEVDFGSGDDRFEVQQISNSSGNPSSYVALDLGDGNDVITGKYFGSFVAFDAGAGDDIVSFEELSMSTINEALFSNGYRSAAFDLGSGDDILSGGFYGESVGTVSFYGGYQFNLKEERLPRAQHVQFGEGRDVWRLPSGSYEVVSRAGSDYLLRRDAGAIAASLFGVRVSGLEVFQALDSSVEIPFSVGQFTI